MREILSRLRRGVGLLIATLLAIMGVGGFRPTIAAIQDMVGFLGIASPKWLAANSLEIPVRIFYVLAAIAVVVWAFWPRKPKAVLAQAPDPFKEREIAAQEAMAKELLLQRHGREAADRLARARLIMGRSKDDPLV